MMGILEHWGTSPIEAVGLADSLTQIAELGVPPDIILADYQLDDGEDGIAVIEALRARHGPLPAILITANHSAFLAEEAQRAGSCC